MLRVVTIASSENVFLFCVVGFLFRVVAIVSFETGKLIVKEKTLLLLVWGSNRVFCFLFGDGAVCGGGMGLPLLLERIAYCEVEGEAVAQAACLEVAAVSGCGVVEGNAEVQSEY